jgi:hypothetical protein
MNIKLGEVSDEQLLGKNLFIYWLKVVTCMLSSKLSSSS